MEELLIDPWDHLQLPDVVEVPIQLPVLVDEEGSLGPHTWQTLKRKKSITQYFDTLVPYRQQLGVASVEDVQDLVVVPGLVMDLPVGCLQEGVLASCLPLPLLIGGGPLVLALGCHPHTPPPVGGVLDLPQCLVKLRRHHGGATG